MNNIQSSSSSFSTQPVCQPLKGYFKRWENLTFSVSTASPHFWKITTLAFIVLIGAIAYKIFFSNQTNIQEKNRASNSTRPSQSLNVRLETYPSWDTLNPRVSVTEKHLRSFLDYQYEESDQTSLEAHAEKVKFFYGNCDADLSQGSPDLGWGCAWRSIQTCLSSFSLFYTFKSLYACYKRGSGQTEWAEPGYGKQISDENHISSQLYLYKKEAGTSKTPTQWCTKIATFESFTQVLFDHFQKYHTPLMADDALLACSILGIKRTKNEKTILWVADPHKSNLEDGLYYLVLDKMGKKLLSTGVDNNTNGLSTAQSIDPDKGWMLWLPQSLES